MRSEIPLAIAVLLVPPPHGTPPSPTAALLHHPHDVVIDADVVPNYPDDPTVFVSSPGTMSLFLRSQNRGFSWVNSRSGMRGADVLEFEPASDWATSKTAYAVLGSGGLQRTRDGGRTWEPPLQRVYATKLALAPARDGRRTLFFGGKDRFWRSDDGGETAQEIGTGTPPSFIECVAVPVTFAEDATLAVGAADGTIRLTRDGGKTWTFTSVDGVPKRVAFSPRFASDRTIWVATHGAGVLRSLDGGATFARASRGLRDPDVNDVLPAANPDVRHLFAATRDDGVYRSRDAGDSWELLPLRVEKTDQTDNHHVRLALSPRYPEDPAVYLAAYEGLHVSLDGGESWFESNVNPTRIGRKLEVSPRFPEDGTVYGITYGNAIQQSRDGGDSWRTISAEFLGLSSYSLALSPSFERDGILLVGVAHGVRRSADRGQTWKKIDFEPATDVKQYSPYEVRKIVFSRDFERDRTVYASCAGGIYKSSDGGETWTGRPPPGPWTRRVAMSPQWSEDRTLFSGGLTIHRSTDDGATWSGPLEGGRSLPEGWEQVLDVVCAPDFSSSGEVYAIGAHGGFLRSTDRGQTWKYVPDALEGFGPTSVRLSPTFLEDGTIYVATAAGGLFVSRDRGVTWSRWTPLGSPVDTCFQFALSPDFARDGTLFAGTFGGICRSRDFGKTWEVVTESEFYDDGRDPWIYRGDWGARAYPGNFNFAMHSAETAGPTAILPFTGRGVRIYGARGPDQGIAEILIDGKPVERVDTYAPESRTPAVLYENLDLPWGFHDVGVRILGEKNPLSLGRWISVDGADVAYRGSAEDPTPVFSSLARIATGEAGGTGETRGEPTGPDGEGGKRVPLVVLLGAAGVLVVVAALAVTRRRGEPQPLS